MQASHDGVSDAFGYVGQPTPQIAVFGDLVPSDLARNPTFEPYFLVGK
jgi:hypothetical protein